MANALDAKGLKELVAILYKLTPEQLQLLNKAPLSIGDDPISRGVTMAPLSNLKGIPDFLKLPTIRTIGRAITNPLTYNNLNRSAFSTPDSVLLHELGHFSDLTKTGKSSEETANQFRDLIGEQTGLFKRKTFQQQVKL